MEKAISGEKFKFLPQDSDKSKRIIYNVKLTDDALIDRLTPMLSKKKIGTRNQCVFLMQTYIESISKNGSQNNKLQIRFNQDNGEIVAYSNGEEQSMSFFVGTIPDPKNHQCVQSVPGKKLLPVGDMEKKLIVSGNDKVFETTRDKFIQFEEKNIRKCVKEIKPSEPTFGRLGNKKNGQVRPTTLPSQLKNNPAFSKSVNQTTSSPVEKPVAPTRISEPTRTTPTSSEPASRVSFSAASNNGSSTKPPATARQQNSMPTLNGSENLNGWAGTSVMKLKSIGNSVVANFSLRERVIHILALKPLKKIELLTQLENQGVTDRDRVAYNSVCYEVAQRNSSTNEYSLSRECYRELKPDWPLYTEENRAVIRSLLEKLETSPVGSASNTPDLSPCHSTNSQSPIGSRPKMPGPSIDEVNYTLPTSKKRRIAHAQPPSTQQPSTQQPLQQSQQQPAPQPPPRPLQQQPKDPPKKKVRTKSAPNKNSSVSVQPKVPDVIKSKNKQDNRGLSNGAAPSAMDESCQENVNNVSVPLSSEDYLRKYVEILTDEQRTSYKNDFNAEYDEYKMLSEKTSDRTKIFRDLNAKMKSTEDVDEYEHFKKEIISEYDKLKCDTKYVEQKVRCAHLHVKLTHIKQLVTDYDQRSKSASSS